MIKLFIIPIIGFITEVSFANDQQIADLFHQEKINGTMVITSIKTGRTFVYNEARANQRFSPASTFKILNTLIAVEENVISGKDGNFKWDGQHYDIESWNQDQTLETAFKNSCVWCYQILAKRIGAIKYHEYLERVHYGEIENSFHETTFWLDNALKISAFEQINFLKNVYNRQFTFNNSSYDTLQEIMRMQNNTEYTLWAKTGWASQTKPQIGWYVGYIETSSDVWFFATNIDVDSSVQLPLRKQLTIDALKAKKIIH